MIIRCVQCHMPFPMSREQVHFALDEVEREGYKRYNAHCPRCGRANPVSKKQLKMWAPDWKPGQAASKPAASKPAPKKEAAKAAPKPKAEALKKTASKPAAKAAAKEEPSTRKKLSGFDLNARTVAALEDAGVSTVAAALKKLEEGKDAVTAIKGVGPAAYDELRDVLKKAGYKLPK